MGKTAIVAGTSGLVGGQLLHLLLHEGQYEKVISVGRRKLELEHPKLVQLVYELNQLPTLGDQLKGDDVFCCLGTTMRKARSKEAFLAVDVEAPIALAQATHQQGASFFGLVSALGANEKSAIFYNQAKGQAERGTQSVGFKSTYIFRPSLLIGPRQEQRAGEDAAKFFYRWLNFIIPQKFKGIESMKVARAMVAAAASLHAGVQIMESVEIQKY